MSNITIVDSTMINVLNYSKSIVSVPTQINKEGYMFEPSIDDQPSLIPMSFSEIRVVNGQSQIFREGYLRFDKDVEKDVYEALNIRDWEDILSDEEIRELILHPTKEKLDRIIKITSISMIDRIRSMVTSLSNIGTYDISNRVTEVVLNRYREIYKGVRNSKITITKTQNETENESKQQVAPVIDIEQIKADMMKQIRAEIEAEMLSAIKNEPKHEVKLEAASLENKVEVEVVNKPKHAGRPKTKK